MTLTVQQGKEKFVWGSGPSSRSLGSCVVNSHVENLLIPICLKISPVLGFGLHIQIRLICTKLTSVILHSHPNFIEHWEHRKMHIFHGCVVCQGPVVEQCILHSLSMCTLMFSRQLKVAHKWPIQGETISGGGWWDWLGSLGWLDRGKFRYCSIGATCGFCVVSLLAVFISFNISMEGSGHRES